MLDQVGAAPDLALLLSPGDEARFCAFCEWTTRTGRVQTSWLYVVLHRRHGAFTHAYRVVPDRRPGHLAIYLEAVREGDAREELTEWLCDQVALRRPPAAPGR